jgi:Ribosomal protein L16p/L10e
LKVHSRSEVTLCDTMLSFLCSTRTKLATTFSSRPILWSRTTTPSFAFVRFRGQLAPKKTQFIKRHRGVIPIPTGGSIKGTTLAFGDYGLRIKGNGVRLTAKQLHTAEEVIRRIIKTVKGSRVWVRVFPDIPVCVKV